jgi:PAS domain S-box-containing protein
MSFVASALPALLAYLDTSGRYVWVNEGYGRWFGRPPGEIVGRHASEVLGAASWAHVRPYVERALAGEEVAFDNTVSLKGGTREVRASYVPHRDGHGGVRGFVALVTDVTETKGVERALRRSERMLEHSQATAQVGSWEVTLDAAQVEVPGTSLWSSEAYRILGYEPGGPSSLALFRSRVHPDDRAALMARRRDAIAIGKPLETEYRIVRPDRSVRTIHAWIHFEQEANGSTARMFGTCQDITERRLADEEVRRVREQLQLVVDTAPAFIARYDRDQRLVWANKSYAARFGKEPDALVGTPLVDLVGERAATVVAPLCERVLAGEAMEVELEIPYPSGPRFVHMSGAPTRDAAGVPDGCVAVLTDVTQGRRLEKERERALEELREADRRKDEFLAMLSHELRNPLAPILNAAEILERAGPGRDDLAIYHTLIARQARHMKRLLDDLLDLSRVSKGKIELQRERVELNVLVRQAVEVSRPMLDEKGHELSLALTTDPLSLSADPTRIVQVFANLINNAAKYTDAGGHIAIVSAVEDGEAVVTVKDDGVGMTGDLLASAFDLFVQGARSLDRAQGGLGIGLTLVQTLVGMHGGSVRAFSQGPGRGTELVVRLPLAPSAAERPQTRPSAEPARADGAPATPDAAGTSLRVLVVDDNVDAAESLGQLAQLLGHDVVLAYDGPAALAAVAAAPPDLVLLDIGLPGLDGYAVAARLRAGNARVALVAITGYGLEEDARRAHDAGFDHHLVKPIEFAQLESISRKASARKR